MNFNNPPKSKMRKRKPKISHIGLGPQSVTVSGNTKSGIGFSGTLGKYYKGASLTIPIKRKKRK